MIIGKGSHPGYYELQFPKWKDYLSHDKICYSKKKSSIALKMNMLKQSLLFIAIAQVSRTVLHLSAGYTLNFPLIITINFTIGCLSGGKFPDHDSDSQLHYWLWWNRNLLSLLCPGIPAKCKWMPTELLLRKPSAWNRTWLLTRVSSASVQPHSLLGTHWVECESAKHMHMQKNSCSGHYLRAYISFFCILC